MNEQDVKALSDVAGLPLSQERMALVAPLLSTWLEAANELSGMIAAPEHRALVPITVVRHPVPEGREE
jgi:hypothetical protein